MRMAKMTKTKCPFCRCPMKFGLDDAGASVVEHELPGCADFQGNGPREFLILASKKILDDTERLIGSRGGN
jgi:hypothetical protein